MNTLDANRKLWNKQQSFFRRTLLSFKQHDRAIESFLIQHAMLHSAKMARAGVWSFEDEILNGLTEEQMRRIPRNGSHSIAWALWHITRIEDVTMNLLVAGTPQIFNRGNWLKRLDITARDTGNAMSADDIAKLSATIDLKALRAYRVAVGRSTRAIAQALTPAEMKQKVDRARLECVMAEGALVEQARGINEFWGRRTIAGLLLMPATRHPFIHLNEMARLSKS
ncbi:MAG: DinB family protein [Chloroflexi bacterium]|nr:DinB family protein [Chloroflexota bacterium]